MSTKNSLAETTGKEGISSFLKSFVSFVTKKSRLADRAAAYKIASSTSFTILCKPDE